MPKTQTTKTSKKEEPKTETSQHNQTEEVKVRGEQLLQKIQELIKEGNVRRLTIKDKDGKVLVQFPLTIGVVGVVLAPIFAAVGAIAALVTECTITVERTNQEEKK